MCRCTNIDSLAMGGMQVNLNYIWTGPHVQLKNGKAQIQVAMLCAHARSL